MTKAVNTRETWRTMHMPGGKLVIKTKFYNHLEPEIILIVFKKTVRKNVCLEFADRLFLQNAPTHLPD